MTRAAILVLGMHRSGTSALTWLLGRLGAKLPGDAIDASGDNARGYWELAGLVKADDQVLRVGRSSWFDPRPLDLSRLDDGAINSRKNRIREAIERGWGSAAPLLAIKDPRQCRFVPLVADVLAGMDVEARAVIMLRNPAEIARSLESRDGTTAAFAHLLWLRHMIDAERTTRGMLRAVVDYDGMLDDWHATLARIAPLAGRDGWQPSEAEAGEIGAFLDPTLRHHRAGPAELEQPLAGIVSAVDAGLRGLLASDDDAARAKLDRAYALFDAAPWLEGDIQHDELRHRRVVPVEDVAPPAPDPVLVAAEPAAPAPPLAPDPSGDAALIRASGLFDVDWYLAHYPDVAASGLEPIDHYLRVGAALGYNPGPLFDTNFYARQMVERQRRAGEAA